VFPITLSCRGSDAKACRRITSRNAERIALLDMVPETCGPGGGGRRSVLQRRTPRLVHQVRNQSFAPQEPRPPCFLSTMVGAHLSHLGVFCYTSWCVRSGAYLAHQGPRSPSSPLSLSRVRSGKGVLQHRPSDAFHHPGVDRRRRPCATSRNCWRNRPAAPTCRVPPDLPRHHQRHHFDRVTFDIRQQTPGSTISSSAQGRQEHRESSAPVAPARARCEILIPAPYTPDEGPHHRRRPISAGDPRIATAGQWRGPGNLRFNIRSAKAPLGKEGPPTRGRGGRAKAEIPPRHHDLTQNTIHSVGERRRHALRRPAPASPSRGRSSASFRPAAAMKSPLRSTNHGSRINPRA